MRLEMSKENRQVYIAHRQTSKDGYMRVLIEYHQDNLPFRDRVLSAIADLIPFADLPRMKRRNRSCASREEAEV